ncbi:oligosaccharide flippase family protein [Halanaerobacter jeridensis]|uniref:Stage V sporulation protein B n=1 Tax=Halanaerobacter jeridensis TaxID=706427 RepID=A0A938XPZ4_9FIRM|nr:stage V sporulation protein B [Halanaerobacter jeridensis]
MGEKKDTLLKGTFILAAAAFISKFLGLIYKIVLSRTIGDLGLGLYEKVYPIYTMILTVAIVGIPVAISKLVSEKRAEDKAAVGDYIFKSALKINFVFGLLATIVLILLAKPIARYGLDDIDVYYSIIAIAPAIFLVSIMASYRGYFQGRRNMMPTAISQVVEQLIRMTTMIALAYFLLPYGVEFAAAGAASGALWGAIGGLIIILIIYYRYQKNNSPAQETSPENFPDFKKVMNRIFSLAFPVTIGALILPLMRFIDASMITRRLKVAGVGHEVATSLYGQFNGMAMTLVRFPTVVATSLAVNLVPAISEAYTLDKDKLAKRRIRKAFKLAIYVSLPASMGLFILARPLCVMIFDNANAALSLRYVALGVVAVSLQQMTASILQGFDQPKLPARNLFFGALLNAVLNYFLTANPALGIRGAALGTLAGFTLAAVLNIISVFKITKPEFDYKELLLLPTISGGVMSGFVLLVYYRLNKLVGLLTSTLAAVLAGVISYFLLLLVTGGLKEEDLRLIPKVGNQLADVLVKLGLVRG